MTGVQLAAMLLESFPQGVVLDEFQRIPELVSYIQVMVDAGPRKARFILTGSQQFEVMSKVSQSLAGRVGLLKLLPLAMEELQAMDETPASILGTAADNGVDRANQWIFAGSSVRLIYGVPAEEPTMTRVSSDSWVSTI